MWAVFVSDPPARETREKEGVGETKTDLGLGVGLLAWVLLVGRAAGEELQESL